MTTVGIASAAALGLFRPLEPVECPLREAHGRVLAAPFVAARALPPYDASAMDGFAVRADDVAGASEGRPVALRVVGSSRAGHPFEGVVAHGEAVAIATGAALPRGADAVVVREDATLEGARVDVRFAPKASHHVRRAGSELAAGRLVLDVGATLDGAALALLASQNAASVSVRRMPRVTVISLGDELVPVGEDPGPYRIVASNGLMVRALAAAAGADAREAPLVPDEPGPLLAALEAALSTSDVVVTTGGASVGDHDGMRAAMQALGCDLVVDKVRMKPGKPVMAGLARGVPLVALPGNPVAAFVGFHLFVRPGLGRALGRAGVFPEVVVAPISWAHRRSAGRPELLRGRLGPDGFTPATSQGSADLRTLVDVNALAYVEGDVTELDPGTSLRVLRLDLEPSAATLDLP